MHDTAGASWDLAMIGEPASFVCVCGGGLRRVSGVSQLGRVEVTGWAVGGDSSEEWCLFANSLAARDDPLNEVVVQLEFGCALSELEWIGRGTSKRILQLELKGEGNTRAWQGCALLELECIGRGMSAVVLQLELKRQRDAGAQWLPFPGTCYFVTLVSAQIHLQATVARAPQQQRDPR